jgi:hypothetical protein
MSISFEESDYPDEQEQKVAKLYLVEQVEPNPDEDQNDVEPAALAVSDGEVPGVSLDWLSRQIIISHREEIRTMGEYMRGTSILDQAGVKFEVPIHNIRSILPAKSPGKVKFTFHSEIAGTQNKQEVRKPQKTVTTTISSLSTYVDNMRSMPNK